MKSHVQIKWLNRIGVLASLFIFILFSGTIHAASKVGSLLPENAIIGNTAQDQIGSGGIWELPSGNIVIVSPRWNDNRGAVTCLTPEEYREGGIVISAENSLIGDDDQDFIGFGGIRILSNGHYVVLSPRRTFYSDFTYHLSAGAVTWVNGSTCVPHGETTRGAYLSPINSLVGTYGLEQLGKWSIIELANGNYLVPSPNWIYSLLDNSAIGAVAWADGSVGIAGQINETNALVGSRIADSVGSGGVRALSNGHYVVVSPKWDNGTTANVGAITWGNGLTGTVGVIGSANSLIGSHAGDQLGSNDIKVLSDGNYVVASEFWDNDTVQNVGAVTWINGSSAAVGEINPASSLVGSSPDDRVGHRGISLLENGHYVVTSPFWDNGATANVGAITWANSDGSTVGAVSPANSLIGSSLDDKLGISYVQPLMNGNYVVGSELWDNVAAVDAGAVTWGDGDGSTVGVVSAANSLVGSSTSDSVGIGGIRELNNGHYVVASNNWNGGIGAVTWSNGEGGTVGAVSPANSLVGSHNGDMMYGSSGILPLSNGHYVVISAEWDNGTTVDAGAVTWGNGLGGTTGVIGAANSLIGTHEADYIGMYGIMLLTNDHYVVTSPLWNNGKGAATWANGNGGTVGTVKAANSLIGSKPEDYVGAYVAALPNGNYVVTSPYWDNGTAVDAGAATWGNGNGGTVGTISASNSLVGTKTDDKVGSGDVTPLANGHYLVSSLNWNRPNKTNVGAVTWANGNGNTVGAVNSSNSLIGSSTDDQIGDGGITLLDNGHYVVASTLWDRDTTTDVGAVTWANAHGSTIGAVNTVNSLIGSTSGDQIGFGKVFTLSDGSYLINARHWGNGTTAKVGAVVWSDGLPPAPAPNSNPVLATIGNLTVDEGDTLTFDADATDSDLPVQTLTFSIAGQPEGATFDTAIGEFSWTATEDDGGEVFNVTVTVTDDGDPTGSDSEAFTITVNEVDESANQAPVLAAIGDRFGYVGKPLSFTLSATDPDIPAQTLTFSLEAGAPAGATIDPVSGLFSWPIDETVTPDYYPVTITVTDDDASPLSDSETFTVVVVQDNFISNYGFETPGKTKKIAAGWKAVKTAKTDQRVCNTADKRFAYEGLCAYRFQLTGQAEPGRAVQRNITTNFGKDDVLVLRGMVKANNLKAGARLVIKAVYANKKQTVATVALLPGTYDYQPFTTQLTLKRTPVKIVVQVKGGKAKGTFFVDDMAVTFPVPPGGSEIPPEPPETSEMRGIN